MNGQSVRSGKRGHGTRRTGPAARVVFAALAGGLAAVACGREQTSFDTPARPRLGQLTVCGETGLDGRFDALIRKGKEPRQEVRRPLVGLYDLLKKPDLFRDRSALFVPLAAGLSREPCAEGDRESCPGRAEWADGLRQAGVDAVSLAAPILEGGGARERTAGILADSGICAAWDDESRTPCVLGLGERKAAVVALGSGAGAAERAKRLVARAREGADIVLVALAFEAGERPEARLAAAREVSDAAKPEILVAHHPGPFGGVELREGRILLHNPGALLSHEEPESDGELAFCHRLHFGPGGIAWLEAIPVFVGEGQSRQAFLEEARLAVDALEAESRKLGTEIRDEFGRGILDLGR
jgi:hypothetical protein